MYMFYKTTNLVNEKYYYGVHRTDYEIDCYLGSGVALKRAIAKYGKENFVQETLCVFESAKEAFEHEAAVITENLVNDPQCYNMRLGGKGGFEHINSDPNR